MKNAKSVVRIMLLFVMLLSIKEAEATGQIEERLFWAGKTYKMLRIVLHKDMYEYLKNKYNIVGSSTALWRGYVGYWSIKDGKLCIDSLRISMKQDNVWKQKTIYAKNEPVFKDYVKDGEVFATWFSGKIVVASGRRIWSENIGFSCDYEYETICEIASGKVKEVQYFYNYGMGNIQNMENKNFLRTFCGILSRKIPDVVGKVFVTFAYDVTGNDQEPKIKCKIARDDAGLNERQKKVLIEESIKYVEEENVVSLYRVNVQWKTSHIIIPLKLNMILE